MTKMDLRGAIRGWVLLGAGVSSCVLAQRSTLPATAPTSAGFTPGTVGLPLGTAGPAPAANASKRAIVTYTNGQLRIAASNASLNQTLREVSRLTGMKITGGVNEERVFGTFGPAAVSEVMASLLDGTSTNLLIVNNGGEGASELILTPRRGGPSPPNPNAATDDANYDPPQQPFPQIPQQGRGYQGPAQVVTGPPGMGGLPASNGGQTGAPINGGADLGTTPAAFVPAGQSPPDATAQPGIQQQGTPVAVPAADPSQPQSPNGVSTPQQIYEQLMKLRQQQQQQQPQNPQ